MSGTDDLTIIFYTANVVPEGFAEIVRSHISGAKLPLISVSRKPLEFGRNITVDLPYHHLSIYRQALIGAREATTKYIALTEDDVLYSPEHFKHRPQPGKFAYNAAYWGVYTWVAPAVFSWKGRRNLSQLICERELFIKAVEERLALDNSNKIIWGEPGKYERQLGLTVNETETFYTNPPNIMFSHETAMGYGNLGKRKRLGELLATEIPYWGTAKQIRSMYREEV